MTTHHGVTDTGSLDKVAGTTTEFDAQAAGNMTLAGHVEGYSATQTVVQRNSAQCKASRCHPCQHHPDAHSMTNQHAVGEYHYMHCTGQIHPMTGGCQALRECHHPCKEGKAHEGLQCSNPKLRCNLFRCLHGLPTVRKQSSR